MGVGVPVAVVTVVGWCFFCRRRRDLRRRGIYVPRGMGVAPVYGQPQPIMGPVGPGPAAMRQPQQYPVAPILGYNQNHPMLAEAAASETRVTGIIDVSHRGLV